MMIFERWRGRLEEAQRQPDHVRLRLALTWTVVTGLVLLVLWLVVLLPLQLYLGR